MDAVPNSMPTHDFPSLHSTHIEIHLPLRPIPYARGAGPPLAALGISFQNDTTAKVVEKIVLPLKTAEGHIQQQMHYIVQWTDLPAASVAITAKNILDYVSPRTLEDFEYKLSLDRDRAEEEHQRRQEEAQARPIQKHARPQARGPRNRGISQPLQQITKDTCAETAALPLPSTRTTGPSLSTPQKSYKEREIEDSTEMEEDQGGEEVDVDDEEPTDAAIYRQLFADSNLGAGGHDAVVADSTSIPDISSSADTGTGPTPMQSRTTGDSVLIGWTASLNGEASNKGNPGRNRRYRASLTPVPVSSSTRKVKSMQKSRSTSQDQDELSSAPAGDPEYEVSRLESDTIGIVDGIEGHWFRVRWKGNWPKDQNPTWEPKENLPRGLVEKYLKRKASKSKLVSDQPIAKLKKYASVAEAFEDAGAPADSAFASAARDENAEERFEV